MSTAMNNELSGFVMRTPSGTVGVVESNSDRTATLYVLYGRSLRRVMVPTGPLKFIEAGPEEFSTSLRLLAALPADVQNRPEMKALRRYIAKIGNVRL